MKKQKILRLRGIGPIFLDNLVKKNKNNARFNWFKDDLVPKKNVFSFNMGGPGLSISVYPPSPSIGKGVGHVCRIVTCSGKIFWFYESLDDKKNHKISKGEKL